MNKYYKALQNIISGKFYGNDIDTLEELIDKSKYLPTIQVVHPYGCMTECRRCHNVITTMMNYCSNCGQRIREEN